MGRHNRRLILKVKYTEGSKPNKMFGTRFKLSGNHKGAKCGRGRIVGTRKVSKEEVLRVGEYNLLPEQLMREFNANREVEHNA